MDETERRRHKQLDHNERHGITPRGVEKAIADILEGAVVPGMPGRGRQRKVAESRADYTLSGYDGDPKKVAARIAELEQKMYECAKNLEFEEAARVRDEITGLTAL